MSDTPKLSFDYDEAADVLTVEGVRYSGDLMRSFAGGGLALNEPFVIVDRSDGLLVFRRTGLRFASRPDGDGEAVIIENCRCGERHEILLRAGCGAKE